MYSKYLKIIILLAILCYYIGTGSTNLKPGGANMLSPPTALCVRMAHYFPLIFNLNNYKKAIQIIHQYVIYFIDFNTNNFFFLL